LSNSARSNAGHGRDRNNSNSNSKPPAAAEQGEGYLQDASKLLLKAIVSIKIHGSVADDNVHSAATAGGTAAEALQKAI